MTEPSLTPWDLLCHVALGILAWQLMRWDAHCRRRARAGVTPPATP